jgi:hypothetical protein
MATRVAHIFHKDLDMYAITTDKPSILNLVLAIYSLLRHISDVPQAFRDILHTRLIFFLNIYDWNF